MATFYVLPPRECLEQAAADFLARLLPGVSPPVSLWDAIAGELVAADRFFVHREDLPGGGDLAADLADGFGADAGDAVVEVSLPVGPAAARVRRSVVPAVSEHAAVR